MEKKLTHDATASISATIYQFYVALDNCFQLTSGQKLYIEKYGDISITGIKQIEVKNYSDNLTDLHENLWKTLDNWLQVSFKPIEYKELILLTTQDFSKESTLRDWNIKNGDQKYRLLENIASKYKKQQKKDAKREAQVNGVLSEDNKEKLASILNKFIIMDCSILGFELYDRLKDTRAGHIPSLNRNDYINSLLGFIIAPETVTTNCWEISYEKFSMRVQYLTEQYCTHTKIFPQIHKKVSENEVLEKLEHLFVKKIDEINYTEVKNDAISDYLRTNHIILNELQKYSVPKEIYEGYSNDLIDAYKPKYRKAKRELNNSEEVEKKSQDFYDDITGSSVQPFTDFNSTPPYFRNGVYHNLADDEDQDIKWFLKTGGSDD